MYADGITGWGVCVCFVMETFWTPSVSVNTLAPPPDCPSRALIEGTVCTLLRQFVLKQPQLLYHATDVTDS